MSLKSLITELPRMLGSKGRYSYNNPSNFVVFNCTITLNGEKIHHCDVDFSLPSFSNIVEASKVEPEETVAFFSESDNCVLEIRNGEFTKIPEFVEKNGNNLTIPGKNTEIKELLKASDPYPLPSMEGIRSVGIPESFYKSLDLDSVLLKDQELLEISKMDTRDRPSMSFYWHRDEEEKYLKKYYTKLKRKYKDDYTVYKALTWVTLDLPLNSSHPDLLPGFIYFKIKSES